MKKMIVITFLCAEYMAVSAQSVNIGQQYFYYQRYISAESFFHNHLRQQPEDGGAWFWLVRSYLRQDELQAAYDSLAMAPSSLSNDPYFLVAKGSISLAMNKPEEAMGYFNKAVDETRGKDPALLNAIAEAQLDTKSGNTTYALELLQKATKKDRNNALLYVTMGNVYFTLHNGSEAYKAYTAAIEKDKNYAEAYYRLGQIFLSQKNTELYLENFKQAVTADKVYAPAYYELYNQYLYTDPAKAMEYFRQYASLSDSSLKDAYAYTDLLYLNKRYEEAITHAKELITSEEDSVQPRLYKLLAYSYGELKDTANALASMQQYFRKENDSNMVVKDFETMARLFVSQRGMEDSAIHYYTRAIASSTDSSAIRQYYKDLATLSGSRKDYAAQAEWLGKYYAGNDRATNVDLFNWGLTYYRAGDYKRADSVFGLYTDKYPDQGFGYYWRARSNAAIDTTLEKGLAVPHYEKLVATIADDTLTTANKKWMVEAYSYLAAYETNTEKDYKEAISYFDKILEIDPENDSVKKYIEVLEQNLKKEEAAD